MSRARQTEAAPGFTLLEVVVALACVALILGAVLRVFSLGLRTADSAEKRAHGVMLAQSVLAEIATDSPLDVGQASGTFDDGFRWWCRIGLYEDDSARRTEDEFAQEFWLYRIDVAVAWGRQDDPAGSVTLTTLRVSAAPSGGPEREPLVR